MTFVVKTPAGVELERLGIERFLAAVEENENGTLRARAHSFDEERRAFDREVGPVVAVREDEATVVRVARDPAREGAGHAPVRDELPVVEEPALPIEDDGALPGSALREPGAEKSRDGRKAASSQNGGVAFGAPQIFPKGGAYDKDPPEKRLFRRGPPVSAGTFPRSGVVMKIRTVAALGALGMTFTSLSVWSLTDPDKQVRPDGVERWTERRSPLPPPTEGPAAFEMRGTLAVTGRLAHSSLASDRESETFVLVNVRADERGTGRRTERHLSIVIDRSGSMQGKRLENAIAAAQGAVERLSDDDVVSVVDYATTARELVPATRVDPNARSRILGELGRLTASGDTCISCALDTTLGTMRGQRGAVERVLLISDGEATTGVRDVDGMRRVAASLGNMGATVTTIGVDVDYNERMMAAIAQETNGRHYFVSSPDGLARIFDEELRGLERTVARDARLELEFAPGVELEDDRGPELRPPELARRRPARHVRGRRGAQRARAREDPAGGLR